MKNDKKIWIIIGVVILIMMNMQGEKEIKKETVSDDFSWSDCNERRLNRISNGWQCVPSDCSYMDKYPERQQCLWDIGFRVGHQFDRWAYVYDFDNKDASCECMDPFVIQQWNCLYPDNQITGECVIPVDCASLKSNSLSSIVSWSNSPTSSNKNAAISTITDWAAVC